MVYVTFLGSALDWLPIKIAFWRDSLNFELNTCMTINGHFLEQTSQKKHCSILYQFSFKLAYVGISFPGEKLWIWMLSDGEEDTIETSCVTYRNLDQLFTVTDNTCFSQNNNDVIKSRFRNSFSLWKYSILFQWRVNATGKCIWHWLSVLCNH